MAEKTGIPWCKSTTNFWIGCSHAGPGCDGCYAERSTPARVHGIVWGAGQPRHRTAPQTWNQLDRWNRQAPESEFAGREGFWPVFVDSLSDFFDNEVPPEWRAEAWAKMRACPNLTFLIVTKRIGNAARMLPADWGNGYPNVWIIATVVNQPELNRDIGKLVTLPAAVRGLSIEPQLEGISLRWLPAFPENAPTRAQHPSGTTNHLDGARRLDWVICGGESDQPGHPAREFRIDWAERLATESKEAGLAFFMKQLGHKPTRLGFADYKPFPCTGKGEDPEEWPASIQRREFPVARQEVAC